MMDGYVLCSEPSSTLDLLEKYQKAPQGDEKKVLKDVAYFMIGLFEDSPRHSYLQEAAVLSLIVQDSPEQHKTLMRAIGNFIIGASSGTIIDPRALQAFTFCVRQASDSPMVKDDLNLPLGSVLNNLQSRLEIAKNLSQSEEQYQIVSTLCVIFDAMGDIGVKDISREHTHNPLLESLRALKENKEPRLAQSASYAYEALLGISNDEGKLSRFWRYTGDVIIPLANIAGAVATFDPTKIIDATPQVMNLLSTIATMVSSAQKVFDESQSLKETAKSISNRLEQKDWYLALRYADLLITANAFKTLQSFLDLNPCTNEDNFLSGLLAQLERAWHQSPKDRKRETETAITNLVESLISRIDHKKRLASAWLDILAEVFNKSTWKKVEKPTRRSRLFGRKKDEKHQGSHIPPFHAIQSSLKPQSDLLKIALPQCDKALEFYASNELGKSYAKGYLQIKRLSGQLLHMDQCYINLAIMEISPQWKVTPGGVDGPSAFDLSQRSLDVSRPAEKSITLPQLFERRKTPDKRLLEPRRILIRGRAGVGKSTLCKKIVHEFLRGQLWKGLFDRVIWIPLQSTARKPTLGGILEEYLQSSTSQIDRRSLVEALEKKVNSIERNTRTLLLLDGLDEVPSEAMSLSFVRNLLNHPNVIITSRPYALHFDGLDPVHLELETMGFQEEQVQSYLSNIVPEDSKREAISDFIGNNWLIQSLVRIPIQLNAICYSWDDEFPSDGTTTMTTLYEQIETRLWKKDLIQLGKADSSDKFLYRGQLEARAGDVMDSLEFLAFSGLVNHVVVFDQKYRQEIDRHHRSIWKGSGDGGISDNILDKLSFLRTTDSSKRNISTYHFLHLTFQEYFAARYFTKCWISSKLLRYPEISSTKKSTLKSVSVECFLGDEKYSGRFDVFWRFVTGLLCAEGDAHLDQLLATIDEEPHDLLGVAHMRLLMHCLNEIPVALKRQRERLEDLCFLLYKFEEYEYAQRSTRRLLVLDQDFPRRILKEMLASSGTLAWEAISCRPGLIHDLQDFFVSILADEGKLENERMAALDVLRKETKLSEQCQKTLRDQLERPLSDAMTCKIIEALLNQASLSNENLNVAIDHLHDSRDGVAICSFRHLHNISPMSETVLRSLIEWLQQYQKRDGPAFDVGAMSLFLERAEASQMHLMESFKDQDVKTKMFWCELFRGGEYASDSMVTYLISCIFDKNEKVQDYAARILSNYSLNEATLTNLASQLETGESSSETNELILMVLRGASLLPDATIDVLLSKSLMGIREALCLIIPHMNLPGRAIDALIKQTEAPHEPMRQDAIIALSYQVSLPDEYYVQLFRQMEGNDSLISRFCDSSQWEQRKIPSCFIDALVEIVKEDFHKKRWSMALLSLAKQKILPDKAVETILDPAIVHLQINSAYVDVYARHLSQKERFRDLLMDLLNNTEDSVSVLSIVGALDQYSLVTNGFEDALLHRLETESFSLARSRTASVLWKHSPNSILSRPRSLSTCYDFLLEISFEENMVIYSQRGSVYLLSSQGRRKLSFDIDEKDVISMLLDEARARKTPVTKLYSSWNLGNSSSSDDT